MFGLEQCIQNSDVGYKYLIKLAMTQKVSWNALKTFIRELTSDLETAIKLNDILLQELESLHSKIIENEHQENIFEEQETVKKGSENEVMVQFTKQDTIGDELSFIDHDSAEEEQDSINESEFEHQEMKDSMNV